MHQYCNESWPPISSTPILETHRLLLPFHATACPRPLSRLIFTNHLIGSAFKIQEEIGAAPLWMIQLGSIKRARSSNSYPSPWQRTLHRRNTIVGRTMSQKSENHDNGTFSMLSSLRNAKVRMEERVWSVLAWLRFISLLPSQFIRPVLHGRRLLCNGFRHDIFDHFSMLIIA